MMHMMEMKSSGSIAHLATEALQGLTLLILGAMIGLLLAMSPNIALAVAISPASDSVVFSAEAYLLDSTNTY